MFKLFLVCAVIALVAADSTEVKSRKDDVRPDGYDTDLVLDNGVVQTASGDEHGNVHGNFGWVSPEGEHVEIKYTADENGYQPSGANLPTPPPVPEAILKAIAYINSHPPAADKH